MTLPSGTGYPGSHKTGTPCTIDEASPPHRCLADPTSSSFHIGSCGSTLDQVVVFSLGAGLMRSFGCTINDMFDKSFDAQVTRTRARPLANGTPSSTQALVCLVIQLLVACTLLLFLKTPTVVLAIACLPLQLPRNFMSSCCGSSSPVQSCA